jgi:uncharacterized cupredoxin-like copper-binding protein
VRRVLLLCALALSLTACGNDTDATNLEQTTETGSAAEASQTLQLEAAPNGALKFDVEVLKATAQTVQLVMTNPAAVPHNIAVKGNGVDEKGPVVSGGSESRLTLRNLKPGTYTFYCSVPGHEDQMNGKLIVGAPA